MPTQRSPIRTRSGREESTEETSDWSMNTPATTATETSAATASTAATSRQTEATTSSRGKKTLASITIAAKQAATDAATQSTTTETIRAPRAPIPKTFEKPAVPPLERSKTVIARSIHSAKSTKSTKRMELEARLELRKKQLQAAESAVALAETELELIQCESEKDEAEEAFEVEHASHVEQWVNKTTAYMETEPKEIEQAKPARQFELKELAEAIAGASRILQPNAIPPKIWDLPDFNGSHEDWLPFKRAYEDSKQLCTNIHNMARLRRSISGTAKEAVRSLLFVASDPEEVISALESRFGRPDQLALSELQKIRELPKIGDTPRDICMFASRINNAITTICALNKPHYLHSPEITKSIVDKLSPIMRYRWYDYKSRTSEEEPPLVKLKKYLTIEAEICSEHAPPEPISTFKRNRNERKYPVNALQDEREYNEPVTTEVYKKSCFVCNEEHWTTECQQFKNASINERWEIAKQKKLCFKCLRLRHMKSRCRGKPCRECKRPHHSMLHSEPRQATEAPPQRTMPAKNEERTAVNSVYATERTQRTIYLKIIPVDVYGPKGRARILALLDEGSTISLLDSAVATKIGAIGEEIPLTIETIGGELLRKENSQSLSLQIKGAHGRHKKTLRGVRTVEHLKLSPQSVDSKTIDACEHLKSLRNKLLYKSEQPTLLIGQDNWDLIVSQKVLKGRRNEPAASLTKLGWVLHGCCTGVAAATVNFVNHCHGSTEDQDIENLIKRHFDLDSIGIQAGRPSNDADERAIKVLESTTRRLADGRYESGLLWKKDEETLPNNYSQAINRLRGIEKKLEKNATLRTEYENQIANLLEKGYAETAPSQTTPGRTFYLPHFAVVHPQKKKMRIVFDAAARYDGKSLNDALLPGPDLLQSLFGVLLRFREGPVAVVADIKEMFLRIRIKEEDRDSLRFLWRDKERTLKPKEYRMTSVIFGAASSPATAIYVKNHNARRHEKEHPEAVKAIVKHHYMDDYLHSFANAEEAKRISIEVDRIHKEAGFELRQWASNDENVTRDLKKEDSPTEKQLGQEEKTLGMRWLINEDMLAFNVGLRNTPSEVSNGERAPTKREVTSTVMSTFDPMGLAAPALVKGKILIQDLWRTGLQWDEAISDEQKEAWDDYIEEIKTLRSLKIPRCIAPTSRTGDMHTFVDASETAYAAVVYFRTITANGDIHISLMAGKAKVAPKKPVSVPRLELQAALLGARLATNVSKEVDLKITSKTFWSDSTTVLQWIKAEPRRFKTFVAHRLAEIEDLTKTNDWRWVPTKENPADDATRHTSRTFDGQSRWFNGPAFLYKTEAEWPTRIIKGSETTAEEKKQTCAAITVKEENKAVIDLARFSSWNKLLRTTAKLFSFANKCRKREDSPNLNLIKAEKMIISQSQQESFAVEMNKLKKEKPIKNSSTLKNIDVFLDDENILRLNSRTEKLRNASGTQKLPILDGKHEISRLLIEHYHRRFHHGSHLTVANELRQRYWIFGLRNAVRKITRQCQWCILRRQKPKMPQPGDLPTERLTHHQPPFTCTGVDYFGPVHVTIGRRREKRWVALFTCLTTRAVHLEIAASLDVSSMIMALRRMAARRGTPRVLYSDNGTNFVGTNNELRQELSKIKNEELKNAAEKENITWKFIPPGAPHMGGAWERLVRTVKTALAAVLEDRNPPVEVLHTLLTEVEHTVNSRPLTHLSSDPADAEALTPNHFLIGKSCGLAMMGQRVDDDLVGKPSWKTAQRMADHFWSRWIKEYLPTLMPRKLHKETPELQRGDVVSIVDASLPRNTWPRGIIEDTFPGPDGRTRIVNVRTRGGLMRRPVTRLILLTATTRPTDGVPDTPCTGGEIVSYVAN